MINGIILVLGNTTVMRAEYVQALTLMFAAFVALGLDAFLFGIVTGESTNVIHGVTACRRAWTESMFASFIVLFSAYLPNAKHAGSEWMPSLEMLDRLSSLIRGGVAVGVVAFLYLTARSYLQAVFTGRVPILGKLFLIGYVIIGGAAVVVMTAATALAGVDNDIAKFLRVDDKKQLTAALSFAIWASVIYTVLSALMTAVAASISARLWNPAYPGVRVIIAVTVAWVSVVSLVPLLFLLYRTVPGLAKPLPDADPAPGPAAIKND
jgi:hypothetical protein